MLNIYIARHGQDQDNIKGILNGQRDMELTDQGIEQANSVAKKINDSKIKFDQIYSSPLKRAFKTAQIISEKTNNPTPVVMQDLIERNFGVMTGKHHSCIISECSPKIIQSKDITYFLEPEGAETFPQLVQRAQRLLKKIKETHGQGNILLVSHGDIGKMIYAAYYNLDWQETLTKFYFGNADLILLSKQSSAKDVHVFKITEGQTEAQKI